MNFYHLVISILLIVYAAMFFRDSTLHGDESEDGPASTQVAAIDNTAYMSLQKKLESIADDLKRYELINEKKTKKLEQQQKNLKVSIARLVEENRSIHEKMSVSVDSGSTESNSLTPTERDVSEDKFASQAYIGRYMDVEIDEYRADDGKTETTRLQTLDTMNEFPELNLDDVKCSASFCRAKFSSIDGQVPDLSDLWGYPPFVNQGFTLPHSDGSLLLYFTEANTSLEDLAMESSANLK